MQESPRARHAPIDHRLLDATRGTRRFLAGSVAAGAITAVLVVAQAWFLSTVAAGAFVGRHDLEALAAPVVGLLAVVAGRSLLAWWTERGAARASAAAKSDLRTALVGHAAALGGGDGGPDAARLTVLATTGIDALDAYFSRYLPQVFLAVIVPLGVIAVLAGSDVLSAVIVALTVPLIPIFGALVGAATREHTARQLATLDRLANHFLDVVTGLPTLKVFGRAKAQAEAVAESSEQYREATMSNLRISFLSALVLELLATVAVALVAVAVGLRLLGGHLEFRTALFVLVLAPEAYLPLRQLATHYHASAAGLEAADAVFGVLEQPLPHQAVAGTTGDVPDLSAGIVVESLSVVRPGRSDPAPRGLSFEVAAGETVALVGPSGSGKSTALAVMLGLASPTTGRVLIGHRDLRMLDLDAWRSRIAWVPQRPHLFASSIAQNVRLGRHEADDEEVRDAVARAHLDDVVARLPAGLATRLGEGGAGLSHGERQRVALARAFLRDAPVVLLDEPTANLDGRTEELVLDSVADLVRGRTAVVVTHRPALLVLADRVVVLAPAELPA